MKFFLLQTMWDLVAPEAEGFMKRRYFKTRKAANKAAMEHRKYNWCIGTRVVEVKVED